jgi:hypothetical protein
MSFSSVGFSSLGFSSVGFSSVGFTSVGFSSMGFHEHVVRIQRRFLPVKKKLSQPQV